MFFWFFLLLGGVMISSNYIVNRVNSLYAEAVIKCKESFSISIVHELEKVVVKKMSAMGTASNRGVISISNVFVGTEEYNELDDTINHEIAHLIAGISSGHNKYWKWCCVNIVNCKPSRLAHISSSLREKKYNYILYFDTETRKKQVVRYYSNRPPKKYLEAKPRQFKSKGEVIERFYYQAI